jgi:hypothetical protein
VCVENSLASTRSSTEPCLFKKIQRKLAGKQHLQHTELKTAMINKQHWAKYALTRMPLIPEILQSAHAAQRGFELTPGLSSNRCLPDIEFNIHAANNANAVDVRALRECACVITRF